MHLIVPFAGASRDALQGLALPRLARLLARLVAGARIEGEASTLTPPHERALAGALGITGADGALPLAALAARDDGVPIAPDAAVALLTPVHWQVGRDAVVLADPARLRLDATASRAAFDALRGLFESEGYALHWAAPLRWYAVHDELDGLRCASIDRAVGRDVAAWLPAEPRARRIRRLQNEAQMLLHDHPLNQAREAAGLPALNSFWLSGCGRAPAIAPERRAAVVCDDTLRAAALAGDADAWRDAWRALDADAIARLAAEGDAGAPVALTLAGERHAQRFDTPADRPGRWARLATRWSRSADPLPLLEAL